MDREPNVRHAGDTLNEAARIMWELSIISGPIANGERLVGGAR
jgi:hypothetical protein